MNQLTQQTNKVYSKNITVANGISAETAIGSAGNPFYLGQSQILGITCSTTPNPNQGAPFVVSLVGVGAQQNFAGALIRLGTTNNTDNGTYTVYWTNSTLVGGNASPAQPA